MALVYDGGGIAKPPEMPMDTTVWCCHHSTVSDTQEGMVNTSSGSPMPSLLRRLPWAWLLVAIVMTISVVLREIGLLLSRVETEGLQAFGPTVYTGFPSSLDQHKDIESARFLWDKADAAASRADIAGSLVAWHLWLDLLVLIPTLAMLLALALYRVNEVDTWKARKVWVLPLSYAVADVAETAVTLRLFGCRETTCEFPAGQPFEWISFLSFLKWVLLVAAVLAIVVGFVRPDTNGRVSLSRSWEKLRGPEHPVGAAGGLIWVVVAFALVVALPAGGPLDQIPDVIRSQVEDPSQAWVPTVLALILLLSVVVAGLWSIRYEEDSEPTDHGWWRATGWVVVGAFVLSGALAAVQYGVDEDFARIRLWQPAAPLITVTALVGLTVVVRYLQGIGWSAEVSPLSRARPAVGDGPAPSPWDDPRLRAVGLLAALVVLALGLGLVRAFTPVALTGDAGIDKAVGLLLLGVATAAFVAPALAVALTWALSREVSPGVTRACTAIGVAVALVTITAAVALALNPHVAWGGATGVLALCFAFFATVTGLLGLASHRVWWPVTKALGLGRRTPWGLLVVLCWLVASSLNFTAGYHDARVQQASVAAAPTLAERFAAWRSGWDEATIAQCAMTDGTVPLVLVAAPGGGGKAAFWTGTAMDELFGEDGPLCPQSLFAVSGVSGGAVGLAVTLGDGPGVTTDARDTDPLRRLTDDGPLAQLIAAMLLRDLPQPFVGAADGWADRAEVLETAWEEATAGTTAGSGPLGTPDQPRTIDELGAGWWKGDEPSHRPTIVFNSSSVTDGCRVLFSNVGALPTDAGSCRSGVTTKGFPAGPVAVSIDGRAGLMDLEGVERLQPGDGCTVSGVASVRASTAALMAARFPYLTPSGAL